MCFFPDGLPQMVFANGGDVMMADVHGRFVRSLVPHGKGTAVGIAYHWHEQTIFWSDTFNRKVSLDHGLVMLLISLLSVVLLFDRKAKGT